MSKGQIIRKLRKEYDMTLDDLAELLNTTRQTIHKYENDIITNIPSDKIEILANTFHVSPAYIMGWESDALQELDVKIKFDDYFPLHYCTNLSAGSLEELLDNDPDAIVYVPIKFQLRKKRLHAFKVNGTSMDNVIPDGSIVIAEKVDNALDLKDGTIVVAWVDNGATVKRLYAKESSVTLMPDSSDKSHRPIDVNLETSPIQIIGRVIWHMNPDDIAKMY